VEPAKEVGGDFFDAFPLDDRHICILVGDVAGKGMPAALFMVRAITLLRMSLAGADTFESVLPTVNQLLCENNEEFMFVTLFLGMIDVTSGKMTYMNGGHNHPFFLANGKACDLLELPAGILVGVNTAAEFEVAELTFQPGDTLVVYTDGVTEAENAQHEQFAEERTCEVLESARDAGADMASTVKSLQDAIAGFTKGVVQFDDITIMALRYQGEVVE
jgi:sigma-B regulation protein RsbU (phosphoserine phosphatase)